MTDGEISCALGHLAMLEEARANAADARAVFVHLEDDARLRDPSDIFDPPLPDLARKLCEQFDLVLFGVTTKVPFLGGTRHKIAGHAVFELDRVSIRYLRGAMAYSAPQPVVQGIIREQHRHLHRADAWEAFYRAKVICRIALVDIFAHGDGGPAGMVPSNLEAARQRKTSASRLRSAIKPTALALLRAARVITGRHNVV